MALWQGMGTKWGDSFRAVSNGHEIVNQHGAWVEYRARYPRDYVRFVAEEDQNVIGELMGTCACTDSSSVERELDLFIRRFPEDPFAPQVRARLASVRNGTSGITFNCPPPHYY